METTQVSVEEQRAAALAHYDKISSQAGEFSSFVRDAIIAYTPNESQNRQTIDVTKLYFVNEKGTLSVEEPWASQNIFDIMERDGEEYHELIRNLMRSDGQNK